VNFFLGKNIIEVKVSEVAQVTVNSREIEQVRWFHRHVIEEVIFLFELFDFEWDIENPRHVVSADV
jgi:hypothetical protein